MKLVVNQHLHKPLIHLSAGFTDHQDATGPLMTNHNAYQCNRFAELHSANIRSSNNPDGYTPSCLTKHVAFSILRPFQRELLAKTGDSKHFVTYEGGDAPQQEGIRTIYRLVLIQFCDVGRRFCYHFGSSHLQHLRSNYDKESKAGRCSARLPR